MPTNGPKDYETGFGKPPVATRFKTANRANPRGRPPGSKSLAAVLRRALDAPVVGTDGKRRRLSKRELMVRALVERSTEGDLAATKLLCSKCCAGPTRRRSAPTRTNRRRLAATRWRSSRNASAGSPTPKWPMHPIRPSRAIQQVSVLILQRLLLSASARCARR